MFVGQRRTDGLQIIAGIKSFGDRNRFAKRFPITQKGGAGEHIDLSPGIVDVIFACHIAASEGEQTGERIAEDSAPAVADMHRPGRIGGHKFHIDLFTGIRALRAKRMPRVSTAERIFAKICGLTRMLRKPGPATSA